MTDFASVGLSMYALIFTFVYGIVLLIGIGFFIFNGFGIYRISKNAGIKAPWLAFVPIFSTFALGKIAEKYVKRDGKRSAKFGGWLLTLNILMFLLLIAFIVFLVIGIINIGVVADNAVTEDINLNLSDFAKFIPVVIIYFLVIGISIAYYVTYYVALWRIYAMLDNSNATLFIVLSILFSIVIPFFMFFSRKNTLKTTYAERMGFNEPEKTV